MIDTLQADSLSSNVQRKEEVWKNDCHQGMIFWKKFDYLFHLILYNSFWTDQLVVKIMIHEIDNKGNNWV